MRYTKFIALLIVLALFSACKEESSTGPEVDSNDLGVPIGDYIPAKMGSTWEYSFNYNGNLGTSLLKVTGTRKFDSGEYVKFEEQVEGQIPTRSYRKYVDGKYYGLTPDGSSSFIGDYQLLLFDVNSSIGDKWEKSAPLKTQNNKKDSSIHRLELLDRLDSYIVKGVTYNDIIVTQIKLYLKTEAGSVFQLSEYVYHYAKNVGIIKIEASTEVESIVQELTKYTP